MRNFDYIKDLGLNDLYKFCSAAEENQLSNPDFSAINARKALEYIVRAIYFLKEIKISDHTSLFELIDGEPFREFINDSKVMMAVHYIRKTGNNAAHSGNVTKREAFFTLLNIYNVVGAVFMKLRLVDEVKPFDASLVPSKVENPVIVPSSVEVKEDDIIITATDKASVDNDEPVTEIAADISEAETRKLYIDLMLKEAGWEVLETEGSVQPSKACIEVELKGMPNTHETGYADYVLFGSNGLPLAVIEAKKTSVSPMKGKHQAELYAQCLENQYGVYPVIYYTNGFETNIIDGLGYPPRRLFGFHTESDLELLIQKRGRKDITDFSIKDSITDRHYQKMAIKAVCEHYNSKHRKALLVMATGTGKTRVAISLVDVLARNNWVKNVLFLADRISLVTQAHKNFVKLLPNTTTCVLSDSSDNKDTTARIIFSTYQTMINYIDTDDKELSVGRFDLIIIDEAHRSIFGKYGAIFNYFDAMLIGLTATPRDEVDKSTYDIFEMEQGEPNYAYELEDAVADNYLVIYHGFKRGSLILKEGIKYNNLSAEEKKQMEEIWEYEKTRKALDDVLGEEDYHRDIANKEIFNYIFNEDTIDAVLQDLMENGLKVQCGERIGKTIIFAYNHRHAELIVKRFYTLYPEYGPSFCSLVDTYVTYSQSLIDKFEIRDGDPQIAVSVDMLDTGIDVPDILNLVFFKVVKSKIKFMQMIGRGTRLSKDIFGPGDDKKCFYIFDWCRNFEYFEKNPNGTEAVATESLTERIFNTKARIAYHLQHIEYQSDEYCKKLHDDIKKSLIEQVNSLSDSHISVRAKWESVSHFKSAASWIYISELDLLTLKTDVAPLLPKNTLDENAKKFDVLVLIIELGFLNNEVDASNCIQRVQVIADKLQAKATIPQIKAKMETIKEVLSPVAWENVSLQWLEKVRTELRDLVKFLVGDRDRWFVVDIEDTISYDGESQGITPRVSYKQRIMDFLAANRHLPVLDKIYNMEQLNHQDIKQLESILWEELGSKSDYDKYTSGKMCGSNVAILIRSLIGVDRIEAMRRFGTFISGMSLNAAQEEFLMTVISYVCENGDITKDIVVNDPPFDERLDVFKAQMIPLAKYIDNLHTVIMPDDGNNLRAVN
ncbi:MAG: DEAD/DEAH box helicase family protein [Clostridia bacterium]|nr:DEAD/DEAH box helicase family protein [Clostridia bacterium]MBQ2189152.1 DEAD/DEAH box helicase family protein [Bacteroidales bacterium]